MVAIKFSDNNPFRDFPQLPAYIQRPINKMEYENWGGLRVHSTVDACKETRIECSVTTQQEGIAVHFGNL